MLRFISFALFVLVGITSFSQDEVSFKTTDSLTIYATDYFVSPENPYIILLHQENYSRGEYKDIALKLVKLNYNCLAIDLRIGGSVNGITNETTSEIHQKGLYPTYLDALNDINAAITYIQTRSKKKVILFGSSFSGSLAMIEAQKDTMVKAVIAFSPGEYFLPQFNVENALAGFSKPILAACSPNEYSYVKELLSKVPTKNKTIFKASGKENVHGASALWDNSPSKNEYWLALYMFFKKINN